MGGAMVIATLDAKREVCDGSTGKGAQRTGFAPSAWGALFGLLGTRPFALALGCLAICGAALGCVHSPQGEGAGASPAATWVPTRRVVPASASAEPVVSVEELIAAAGTGAGRSGAPQEAVKDGANAGKKEGGETLLTAPSAPQTKAFSLQEFSLPLTIEAPLDTKITPSQSKDKLGGALLFSYPTKVSLRVMKADARIAGPKAAKVTLGKLAYLPAKTFLKEQPDLLVYERSDGEVYFLNWVKVGGVTYTCQSMGGEESEADLANALAACKTIKKVP